MDELKYEDIKEYLRLRKLQEEDKSDEMVDEIFNEVCKEIDEEKKGWIMYLEGLKGSINYESRIRKTIYKRDYGIF